MRVFILAGEPSGDRLGAALMDGLKTLCPEVRFDGIGGPLMQEQGLVSRFPMQELSIMGLTEVLPKYFHLKKRVAETAEQVLDTKPDVLITIDSPDFCLRVAKIVKAASNIHTVHYVAPSVWAWRPKRAGKMAAVIDHVLALLPFEPPYMEAAGTACDFVGHPVVGEPQATEQEITAFRTHYGLGDAPVLLALPGSRRGEVAKLTPIFGQGLAPFLADHPNMRVVVPATPNVADLVTDLVKDWPGRPVVINPSEFNQVTAKSHKRAAFATASMALAASGTVSLELAAADTPMVIAYKFSWLTHTIMEKMALIDTVTLVNLVSDTRTIPESLGPACLPENIAAGLAHVFENPQEQAEAMRITMERLGRGGEEPGLRAARAVLARLPKG